MKIIQIALLGLCLTLAGACITPPTRESAMVIPPDELRLISTIKRGKDYSNSGRADLAEVEFRTAIEMRSDLPILYNDLGYVLQAQQRLEEAEDMYAKAIQLNANNLASRENLARLQYQRGEFIEAIEQYFEVLDLYNRAKYSSSAFTSTSADPVAIGFDSQMPGGGPTDSATGVLSSSFSDADAVDVLRNIAISYYSLGLYDEAVCHSWLAHIRGVNLYQAGQHARLLMSLEKLPAALEVLRVAVVARQGNVTAEFLLDYGLVLYLTGESNLAKAAFNKVLATASADLSDRRTARFLRILLAEQAAQEQESSILVDTLFEEEPDLCEQKVIDPDNYWPLELIDQVSILISRLCREN